MMRAVLVCLCISHAVVHDLAASERMAFYVKNGMDRGVVLEFRSRDRDKVWPGGGQVYLLEPKQNKSVPIDCEAGERLCYGAWVDGAARISWGIGPNDDRACRDCCKVCTGGTDEIIDLSR